MKNMLILLFVLISTNSYSQDIKKEIRDSIGTQIFYIEDTTRLELAVKDSSVNRNLVIQMWYPADCKLSSSERKYFPNVDKFYGIYDSTYISAAISYESSACLNAIPSVDDTAKLPIVLFSHGWNMNRHLYTTYLEDLAKHGYLVVGIDHPYMGRILLKSGEITNSTEAHFNDPFEMIEYYSNDLLCVVEFIKKLAKEDPWKNLLLLDKVVTIGHSNGFLPALTFAKNEKSVLGCILIDKFDPELDFLFNINKPICLLRTSKTQRVLKTFIPDRTSPIYDIEIKNSNHLSSTDINYLKSKNKFEKEKHLDLIRKYSNYSSDFLDNLFFKRKFKLVDENINKF